MPNPSYGLTISGSSQQLQNVATSTGVALLAATTNTAVIRIAGSNAVGSGNGGIYPGQGIVLPVTNADQLYVIGTSGDQLSYWEA